MYVDNPVLLTKYALPPTSFISIVTNVSRGPELSGGAGGAGSAGGPTSPGGPGGPGGPTMGAGGVIGAGGDRGNVSATPTWVTCKRKRVSTASSLRNTH